MYRPIAPNQQAQPNPQQTWHNFEDILARYLHPRPGPIFEAPPAPQPINQLPQHQQPPAPIAPPPPPPKKAAPKKRGRPIGSKNKTK